MDFQSLLFMAIYQLQTARDAPVPPVLAAILAGLVAWGLTKWRYGAMVTSLKRGIARRDAELATLREQASYRAPAAEDAHTEERGEPVAKASSEQRRALQLIINAVDQAELALRSPDPREADRAMASMGLALQTANRMFGLPIPALHGDAGANLRTGKRFLEQVRPALRAGDEAAAQRIAGAFTTDRASAA